MVRRNIFANAIGGGSAILLNLLITPFLIQILGPEAYGLLGFIASLQIMFGVLDLGLSTTIIREVASDTSADRSESRRLVQTLATIYWLIAVVLGIGLFAAAPWIVAHWLHLSTLPAPVARLGIQILALSVALRWPVSFYSGIITGLQELPRYNAIKVLSAVIRLGGGLLVLLVQRDMATYLWWLALSALIEVALYGHACFRLLPGLRARPGIDVVQLRRIWHFSMSMNLISILSLVFTQADRVLISRLRPLADLGYYSLAVNVVMSLSVIQGFVTSAILPAMAADHSSGSHARVAARYAKATQGLIYAITLPACIFGFFGHDLLAAWVSPLAADRAYVVLAIFGLGFLFNAAVSIPYTLAISTGHTRIPLVVNVAAVFVYLPALYFAISIWGITGAAVLWLLLNAYYMVSLLPLVQVRIAKEPIGVWLSTNFLPFIGRGAVVFTVGAVLAAALRPAGGLPASLGVCLIASAVYAAWAFRSLTSSLQTELVALIIRVFAKPVSAT